MNTQNTTSHRTKPLSIVGQSLATTFGRMWPLYILLLLTTTGSIVAELAPPLLLQQILDTHLKVSLSAGLLRLALLYLAALILSSSLGFAQTIVTTTIGQNILLDLRLLMSRHLSKLPMRYYNNTPIGETMSRLTSDVEAVNALFSAGLINAITNMFKIIGIVVAMFVLNPLMTIITLALTPVIFFLANFFRKGMYKSQLGVRRSVSVINAFLQETFAGTRTLKAFGQEEWIKDRFQTPLTENMKSRNQEAVYIAWFPCVTQVVRAIIIAIVVSVGARTGVSSATTLTIGGLAAFIDLMLRLFSPIEALAQEFQVIQQAMAGLQRIAELLQIPAEHHGELQHIGALPEPQANSEIVTVQGVDFRYSEDQPVLRATELSIPKGAKVALVGRTGAGKTTLLNLIAGLYRPRAGSISICGYAPHSLEPSSRRKLLGVVPQTVHIFEGTVQENITLRDDTITLEQVKAAAKTVGLHEAITFMKDGYQTRLGAADGALSYGETQLLSLARAIVTDPPLLLLDEPTSGLDAITEQAVFDAFRSAGENRTILTISHRLSGVLDADLVYIMAQGHVVQSGSPDELAGQDGWYSVFKQLEDLGWNMQA